jgi:class 3 adenylate cyclase
MVGARDGRYCYAMTASSHGSVRTFVIADIRGYSRFTEEYGDHAAARLAAKFADLMRDGVELRGGELVELRGDEALAVFESARQAIRAALDLQASFSHETDADKELPLNVGIGIDSGEAVAVEEGYRGGALNVAARLCAMAHGGEVLTTASTSRLAGRIQGFRYIDRGEANLKGIEGSTEVVRIAWEDEKLSLATRFAQRKKIGTGRAWLVGLTAAVAAITAGAVVYLTGGNDSPPQVPAAAAEGTDETADGGQPQAVLASLIPDSIWESCDVQPVPDPGAEQTAVCVDEGGGEQPDRWSVSVFPNAKKLYDAYEAIRESHHIGTDQGICTNLGWGGERAWEHGPGRPGGRKLCYFEGNDAVVIWTHERLDQPDHRDILVSAREGGGDHASLYEWWRPIHHEIGKLEE